MDAQLVPLPQVLSRADARDRRAGVRDKAADARDRLAELSRTDTAEAIWQRQQSRVDRIHAGRDRDEGAEDRADIIDCLSAAAWRERAADMASLSRAMVVQSKGTLDTSLDVLGRADGRLQPPGIDA